MFKFQKRSVIFSLSACLFIVIVSLISNSLKAPLLSALRYPLNLLVLAEREVKGIIFYHRNFIQRQMLTEEVNLLKSKLVTLNELSLENARLKSLLGFKQQAPYRLVAARVIGRSPDSWSSSIIIDKGNLQGLRRGMPVITPLGLAGRVVEVATLASRVILVSDPGFGVAAMVERSRQEGLVNGSLKTNLILRYLPADADIKVGDVIITSGLNKACPKGLVIGTVTELISDSSGMSSYATIKPAVNPYNIEEVLIVE